VPTPFWARVLLWLGLPVVAASILFLVVRAAWWLPLPGPLRVIRELPGVPATVVAVAVGTLAGLTLAVLADRESLTVRLTPTEVVLSRPGSVRSVPLPEVAVAFPDRDDLVLLGHTGRELAREPSLVSPQRLREPFTAHGIPWADADPYLASYRRWVPGLPELPETAHALLTARQKALESGDGRDVQELRDELGRLGYAVRDDHKRQYWRRADGDYIH